MVTDACPVVADQAETTETMVTVDILPVFRKEIISMFLRRGMLDLMEGQPAI